MILLKAVVKGVNIDKTNGLLVDISRTSPKFLENLLILEVPELKDKKLQLKQVLEFLELDLKLHFHHWSSNWPNWFSCWE